MSELPALQAMLRETAERRYGRSRRRAIPARIVAVAAAAALVFAVMSATRGRPDPEVAATPTPAAERGALVPLTSGLPAIPVDIRPLQGTVPGVVQRAWRVPWLRGDVLLVRRRNGSRCLSSPDPQSAGRGEACESAARFKAGGVGGLMFATDLHVGPEPGAPLLVVATIPQKDTAGGFTLG